ncbi:replication-relaxation family protein [Nocardiopsis sediminis]|uniref:Replication-relaxation family protein n=2 Tax=Nocardiopsis sediminis TaxID=1778267 RepID=A0ABV8FRZ4_9ACTN
MDKRSLPTGRRENHLLRLARHLTDRDHDILSLLHTHRVLTTSQITQVAFTSHSRTLQRMRTLTALGVVARFCPRLDRGSAPWHYVLDTHGARVVAADQGRDAERARVRRDRQLAVANSAHLAHRVGVNGFFTSLTGSARASEGRAELGEWLNAADAAEWVDARSRQAWGAGLPQPDGYGHWRQGGRSLAFFLEWDTGSETHRQLTAKLERYVAFAGSATVPVPWVLFVFPSGRREANAGSALSRVPGVRQVPVATACLPDAAAPDEAVWRPLGTGGDRVRLAKLATAGAVAWG